MYTYLQKDINLYEQITLHRPVFFSFFFFNRLSLKTTAHFLIIIVMYRIFGSLRLVRVHDVRERTRPCMYLLYIYCVYLIVYIINYNRYTRCYVYLLRFDVIFYTASSIQSSRCVCNKTTMMIIIIILKPSVILRRLHV